MAKETARDRVWKYALVKAVRNDEPAKPAEIAEIADVSERTARDCMLVMSEADWLTRRTKPDGQVEYICEPAVEFDRDRYNPAK